MNVEPKFMKKSLKARSVASRQKDRFFNFLTQSFASRCTPLFRLGWKQKARSEASRQKDRFFYFLTRSYASRFKFRWAFRFSIPCWANCKTLSSTKTRELSTDRRLLFFRSFLRSCRRDFRFAFFFSLRNSSLDRSCGELASELACLSLREGLKVPWSEKAAPPDDRAEMSDEVGLWSSTWAALSTSSFLPQRIRTRVKKLNPRN